MKTLATFFSVLGHPLVVGPVYVVFMAFDKLTQQQALLLSGLILGVITIPIIIHNAIKVKQGAYTNFDVSQRDQRTGFYPFLLSLFICILGLMYWTELPKEVMQQTLIFTGLLVVSYGINFFLKASLHTAILFYISCSLWDIGWEYLLVLLLFAGLTAWSRVYTKKHQLSEVIVGGVLGAVFGWMSLWF